MADNYLLTHHINRNGGYVPWYKTRSKPIRLIVIHTAENLPDWDGVDGGAEAVAKFGAGTTRASWHQTVDSDSGIQMLPDSYTAFHVRGFNSESLGVEIATQAGKWSSAPEAWKAATMIRLATLVAYWCDAHGIPRQLLTRAQVDAGQSGIVGHYLLDPSRRTDPGAAFDWPLLLRLITDDGVSPMKTYEQLVAELSAAALPTWSEDMVAEYIAAGGTTVPTSMTRPAFRFDLAFLWQKFIKPLAARVFNLESRMKKLEDGVSGPSVDQVVAEVIRRLSNG